MCDSVLNDLLNQFSKTTVSSELPGVSFRGKGIKLDSENDCKDVIEAIRKSQGMTFLDLEGNTLGVDAARAIGEALKDQSQLTRALWKDMFTGRMKTEIPKALKFLSAGLTTAGTMLTELDLSDNAFGPIGVEALADLLQSRVCFKLEVLRLNNNGLGITGGKLLASALLKAHSNSLETGQPFALKVFVAGRNRLENDGASALSKVFKTLGSLEEISMPQNGIYHKGVSMLSDALVNNPNLQLLNLNDNTLTAKGAKFLAAALPALQKLRVLNLGDCLLKTKGVIILAEALTDNHGDLQEVILDSNEIRAEGGLAVVRSLNNKPNLTRLSLQGNEFGENGRRLLINEAEKLRIADILECPSDDDIEASEDEESEEEDDDDDDDEEGSEEETDTDEDKAEPVTIQNPISEVVKIDDSQCSVDSEVKIFLTNPNPETFAPLLLKNVDDIIASFKTTGNSLDVATYTQLIMKVSSLGSNNDETIKKRSRDFAVGLYKKLFEWAEKEKQLSSVSNVLLVYLQLIKGEDKQLKVHWDVDCCLNVLQVAIGEQIVPTFTQHILTFFLERKYKKVGEITVA